jgi:hypothetical protein
MRIADPDPLDWISELFFVRIRCDVRFRHFCIVQFRVADPHPFSADTDQLFTLVRTPIQLFTFNPEHQGDANLRPLVYRSSGAPF